MNEPKVDVYVGPDHEHFQLPKGVLCRHSPYFNKAFNGEFKEGKQQSLELVDEDSGAFRLLVQWLLTGDIDEPKPFGDADGMDTSEEPRPVVNTVSSVEAPSES